MRRLVWVIVLLVFASCAPHHASIARRAQKIEGQVWSPYCPGKLLIDCTTTQAGELRTKIVRELRSGRTDAEVLRGIRRDFGPSALARPPSGRSGLIIWLVPIAVFALGGVVVLVRRRRVVPAPPAQPPPGVDDALERLRDEVRRQI
jgi:cytochrome c-type biogenesis protein CcmH/NrfF